MFGLKAQLMVGSAILVAGGISFNAITTYFSSSESGSVDWTDPGGLISLLNMMMLGVGTRAWPLYIHVESNMMFVCWFRRHYCLWH